MIFSDDIELIPISDLDISLDSNITVGYDLTVEDYYTFCTHDGVFIQDTMSVYHPLTNESQQEAKEKMMRVTSGTSSDEFSFGFSKEMWAGLYIITKDKKLTSPAKAVTDEDLENIKDY